MAKKVRKITGRGTGIREAEFDEMKWSGDDFRKVQSERAKKIPQDLTMHLGRGTRTAKAKDIPEPPPRPSYSGKTRVTNRGTGSRKSRNKGSE